MVAGVIHVNHEGTQRCVTDHTHRGGIGGDPLETVQVGAEGIGHDRLDHVAMRAGQPEHVAAVLLGEASVVLAHRLHRAGLHMGKAFAVGEHRCARLLLHHCP